MPWCDECAKFWSPASVEGGACPTCGSPVESPAPVVTERRTPGGEGDAAPPEAEEVRRAPWHFKLLMVALVLYLGYRAYQGVFWLGHHL